MKIKGNTVGTTMPRSNWNQSDPSKADYIKGKDAVDEAISKAQSTADSAVTYARNAQYSADGKVGKTETTAILTSGKWADKKQTVNITGVTKKNAVIVGPSTDSYVAYCEAAVRYHEQGEGTITFICEDVPDRDITLNVLILDEDSTSESGDSITYVRTVNGIAPDKNGNVEITIPDSGGNSGYVLTTDDKDEITRNVLSALPTWTGGSY